MGRHKSVLQDAAVTRKHAARHMAVITRSIGTAADTQFRQSSHLHTPSTQQHRALRRNSTSDATSLTNAHITQLQQSPHTLRSARTLTPPPANLHKEVRRHGQAIAARVVVRTLIIILVLFLLLISICGQGDALYFPRMLYC